MTNRELLDIISGTLDVKGRTAHRRILRMVQLNLLIKKGTGLETRYYLPEDIDEEQELPF